MRKLFLIVIALIALAPTPLQSEFDEIYEPLDITMMERALDDQSASSPSLDLRFEDKWKFKEPLEEVIYLREYQNI